MRFHVGSEEAKFFRRHKFVEFQECLSLELIDEVKQALDKVLATKLAKSIDHASPQELFLNGHDLYRESPEIRRFVLGEKLAEIASQLCQTRPLRIAFDQLIATRTTISPLPFERPIELDKMSSINPVSIGAMICLSSQIKAEPIPYSDETPLSKISPAPHQVGNVIFFAPDITLSFDQLFAHPHQDYLLIAYGPQVILYQNSPRDLHTHSLKRLGYVFGDRLNHETHPFALR